MSKINIEEQKITFIGKGDNTFSADGGYFQFANEHEVEKFLVWLKKLDMEHHTEISSTRQQAVEEYREKIKTKIEGMGVDTRLACGEKTMIEFQTRNKVVDEVLSLLSEEK